ncbi:MULTISPECIES: hypothetical protein [Methylobacterium]|jgi:dienelactone hydrolase|nr:hypothetical protein [Methylobacterium aquaticum]
MAEDGRGSAHLILAKFGAACVGAGFCLGAGLVFYMMREPRPVRSRFAFSSGYVIRVPQSAAAYFVKYSPADQAGFIKGTVSTLEAYSHPEIKCLVHYFYGRDQHARQDYAESLKLKAPNYMGMLKAPVYPINGAHNYCAYPGNVEHMRAASNGR